MVRVLVPSGALGLGYDRAALARGVQMRPDIIAIDGGSTDSGPHYLGTGQSKYSRATTRGEWAELMEARARAGCPLVIGTAGTSGADAAVDWMVEITREIAREQGRPLRLAVLRSGQEPAAMARAWEEGRISALPGAPETSAGTFAECTNIVALAGAEQVQAALETGADIVICGRTTDTAIIAALPLARGAHAGAAWHGAKIAECGALATTDPASGTVMVSFDDTGFTIEPMGETARATSRTVAAHMLYENADPFILHEPGGHLDVTGACYQALDDRRVRVEGSRWVPEDRYTVKLEGAREAGHQSVLLALVREGRYVARVRAWCDTVAARAHERAAAQGLAGYRLELRAIGLDATLGPLDPAPAAGSEVGVLAIVTAPTAEMAAEVARIVNPLLLHQGLPGDEVMPTFAFPFSPAEISRGQIHAFALHHVLTLEEPMEAFRLHVEELVP